MFEKDTDFTGMHG